MSDGDDFDFDAARRQFGHEPAASYEVELPAGGKLHLQSLDEVEMWDTSMKRYIDSYQLAEQNDLQTLGAILTQQLIVFRAQQDLNGMEPALDEEGIPTGQYRKASKPRDEAAAAGRLTRASEEIRALEKQLGIDKKTREAGGQHTVIDYVKNLKGAARQYGLHVSKRVKEYERVCMEARWKLRLLANGDAEDLSYHGLSEATFCRWMRDELAKLEAADERFAHEKGALFVGKL